MKKLIKSKLLIKFIVRSIVLLFVSIACIEYLTYTKTSEIIKRQINTQQQREVTVLAQNLEHQLNQLAIDVKTLAELPSVESLILNKQYRLDVEAKRLMPLIEKFLDNQIKRNTNYLRFGICDRDQQLIFLYPRTVPNNFAIQCTGQPSTQLQVGQKQTSIYSQNNVLRQSTVLGSVFILLDTSTIFQQISDERILDTGFFALFDHDMKLLTKLQPSNQAFSQIVNSLDNTTQTFSEQLVGGKAGYIYATDINPIGWRLYAVAYREEMFAELVDILVLITIVVLLVFAVEVIFLSYFTSVLVTRPINELLTATEKIRQGNYQHVIPVNSHDEIGKLTSTFNRMTQTVARQITRLNQEKQQSSESRALLQNIIDNTPDVVYLKGLDHRYILVNKAYLALFNLRWEDVKGKTDHQLFGDEMAKQFIENDNWVTESSKAFHFEESAIDKNGDRNHYLSVKFPLMDQDDKLYATCGISTDVTQLKETENQLRSLNQTLKLIYNIFETGQQSIVVADGDWNIVDVNRALGNNFGFDKQELINSPALDLIGEHPEIVSELLNAVTAKGYWQGEILLYSKSKQTYAQLCSVNQVIDEEFQTTHYIIMFSDITQLKETQQRLERLAHYDELTGLFNRYQFNISVHTAINESTQSGNKFALFFIDLDNFKYVNDTMGHDIGDGFLKAVAQRLDEVVRTSDIVARFGGDEFILLLKNLRDPDYVTILADKVRSVVNTPFLIQSKQIYASASIGISIYPQDGETATELIKAADIAMYSAKDSGKNAYSFFLPQMNKVIKEKLNFETRMTNALAKGEFVFHYQPKHQIGGQHKIRAEALLRWHQGGSRWIAPDEFVAIAEESGLIVPISFQTFAAGCAFIHALQQQYNKPVEISFNLSGRQFRQHDLAQKLFEIASNHKVEPQSIEFEITESTIMQEPDLAKQICRQIKSFGFKLSMDDFGTGYSSLGYIRDYPLDCIKVDRSFIIDVETSQVNQAIIKAVLSIAQSLSLEVICEGVETRQQLDFLSQLGVEHIQGYYFSKPLNERDFNQYLNDSYWQ